MSILNRVLVQAQNFLNGQIPNSLCPFHEVATHTDFDSVAMNFASHPRNDNPHIRSSCERHGDILRKRHSVRVEKLWMNHEKAVCTWIVTFVHKITT